MKITHNKPTKKLLRKSDKSF